MKPGNLSHLLRVFLPFALGYFLSYLYRTVNAIIAPNLASDIGLDPASLGLLTSVYLLSFGLFQLPLGMLLDRFGPRRVEAALLLVAAAGAFIFSQSNSLSGLMFGRALIGLGVSACLMAAFKAFAIWFPPERLPLANGVQMISGGLGALAATTPVEAALTITDWRGVFTVVAIMTVIAAVIIFLIVPEKEGSQSGETLSEQLHGIRKVLSNPTFWRIAPWAFTAQGAYLSIYGLWSGPWLHDVAGYDRSSVASILSTVAIAMILGYLLSGAIADRLIKRGVKPEIVAATGMLIFLGGQILMLFPHPSLTVVYWLWFGFFGAACILPYAVLAQHFPTRLIGRVNTTLNLMVFMAAFSAQWGIGVIIDFWPEQAGGGYAIAGYQAGFGVMVGLQVLAAIWFLAGKIFNKKIS